MHLVKYCSSYYFSVNVATIQVQPPLDTWNLEIMFIPIIIYCDTDQV